MDWRVDDPDRITFLAMVTSAKVELESTSLIQAFTEPRKDGRNNIGFHLLENRYSRIFHTFCMTLIDETRNYRDDESAARCVERMYRNWKKMFTGCRSLSDREVKGLIAELIFLRDCMIPEYGARRSLESWMHMKFGKQDFTVDDRWFEVKSVATGSNDFKVSSLEQLDRDDPGVLAAVFMQKASTQASDSVTLNSAYDSILEMLGPGEDSQLFQDIMEAIGYSHEPGYGEDAFRIDGIRTYEVREGFPRLRARELNPMGIPKAEYSISLDAIREYEVKRWN